MQKGHIRATPLVRFLGKFFVGPRLQPKKKVKLEKLIQKVKKLESLPASNCPAGMCNFCAGLLPPLPPHFLFLPKQPKKTPKTSIEVALK